MPVVELTPEMTENETRAAQNSNNGYLEYQLVQNALIAFRRGQIQQGPFANIPAGAIELTGQTVSRTTYADLWAYVQANYSVVSEAVWSGGQSASFSVGNGSTTFRLPDMRGKVPVGYQSGDSDFGTIGKNGGSKTHTLTGPQLPAWTPTVNFNSTNIGNSEGRVALGSASGTTGTTSGSYGTPIANWPGTGQPHNIIQPYGVWRFIIWY